MNIFNNKLLFLHVCTFLRKRHGNFVTTLDLISGMSLAVLKRTNRTKHPIFKSAEASSIAAPNLHAGQMHEPAIVGLGKQILKIARSQIADPEN